LIADVPIQRQESPSFLRGKIMAAVRREGMAPAPRSFRHVWLTGIAAAVLLLVALSIRFLPNLENSTDADVLVGQNLVDPAEAFAPVLTLANREKLMAFSRSLDEPLEKELQFVVSDARAAMQTLANNFIPEQMIAQSRLP
ncbi:MAG: hypothetical protein O2960_06470, partial [Verrucomicrobia bacterium]|nr:hypothetical protein [Verrucomicrobiota bacterium]